LLVEWMAHEMAVTSLVYNTITDTVWSASEEGDISIWSCQNVCVLVVAVIAVNVSLHTHTHLYLIDSML
jgi:hypothetical protein